MKIYDDKEHNIYKLNNPIVKKLIKESYFTHNQLLILLDYLHKKEMKRQISENKDKVKIGNKIIKRGVYYRVLRRSKNKLYKSLITIILITSLGIISHYDVTSLLNKTLTLDLEIGNLDVYEKLIKELKNIT